MDEQTNGEEGLIPSQSNSSANLTPELLKQFFDIQQKELEVKAKDLELKSREQNFKEQVDNHNFEFANKSLEVQKEDRKETREQNKTILTRILIFFGSCFFLIIGVIITCLYMNKDEIAKEIIKASIYLGAGALGGWGFTKKEKSKEQQSDE